MWRVILDKPHSAAENMAIDEAIFRSCAEGEAPPTIRLYSWQRPSISLGCLQPINRDKFDMDYCLAEGIDVVRRITGGRAVIHSNDVTFSIAIRECDLPGGYSSVLASHQWLMGGIVAGLRLLGLDAEIGPERGSRTNAKNSADCFAHVAECDVRIGRTKIVGSAQVRRYGSLMEQGSIPYAPPAFDTARVFGRADRAVAESPLHKFSYSSISQALIRGFGEFINCELEESGLTSVEAETSAQLVRETYSNPDWTTSR